MRVKAGAILTRLVRLSRSGNTPTMIDPALLSRIDDLREHHTAGEVATARHAAGSVHPIRGVFDTNAVMYVLKRVALPSRYQRLRARGYWSPEAVAERFGVSVETVQRWRKRGWIHAAYYNDQTEYLYEPFFEDLPPQYHTAAATPMTSSLQEG